MAQGKLTALMVRAAKAGKHGDGGGLWLYADGSKRWVYRYTMRGKERFMGLGAYPTVSLAEARDAAAEARKLKSRGIDPLEHKKTVDQQQKLREAKSLTFGECSARYIEARQSTWKNAKHIQQWTNTLATYATPINSLPVDKVDTKLVMQCLAPIWNTKTETASRVRMRIENVLAWAKVMGYRSGDNPAVWRGHLSELLGAPNKLKTVKHHAALDFNEMPVFMAKLRTRSGIAARALEYCILTATRTSEVTGALWSEIDFDQASWTIPPERMKARKEHRVPLSGRAVAILREMQAIRTNEFIFAGAKKGKGLSNMAMTLVLRRMDYGDITTHGFRSSFRDWAAERTSTPNIVCEMALAHAIGNATEKAYRRGDLFTKREKLMAAWAGYCSSKPGAVVSIGLAHEI